MTERAVQRQLGRLPVPEPARARGRRRLALPSMPGDLAVIVLIAAVAGVGGALAAIAPLAMLGAVSVVAVAGGVLALGTNARRVALGFLVVCLVGYGFLNRGFAYFGSRPVFIGEVLLFVTLIATVMELGRARFRLIHLALLGFMVLGLARTLPFVGTYGIDALRDGVTWIYAAFAFSISILVRPSDILTFVRWYGWFVPAFIIWVPLSTVLVRVGINPLIPGTPVPLIGYKTGDMGVELAGVASFMLAGLYATTPAARRVSENLLWVIWFAAAGIVAALSRGAMLAMATVAAVAVVVRPSARWLRVGTIAVSIVLVLAIVNPTLPVSSLRVLSFTQLVSNISGVVGATGDSNLDGSRRWRLLWWDTIIDYTVNGPYFWDGKGFGINLADADGFQVGEVGTDVSLRAPHNGHIEILARMGVPGLAMWALLQAGWLATMLRAGWRARFIPGGRVWAAIAAWLIVYWAAGMVNLAFDVYLQGPQGGILFWVTIGAGIVVASKVDRLHDAPDEDATPEPAA